MHLSLPPPLQPLFTAKDSPILDFYPLKFKVDMNGKRFAWQVRIRFALAGPGVLLGQCAPARAVSYQRQCA